MDEEMRNEMNMDAEGEMPDGEAETAAGGFCLIKGMPIRACRKCGKPRLSSYLDGQGICATCNGYA